VTARETARAKARALRSRPSAAFPRFPVEVLGVDGGMKNKQAESRVFWPLKRTEREGKERKSLRFDLCIVQGRATEIARKVLVVGKKKKLNAMICDNVLEGTRNRRTKPKSTIKLFTRPWKVSPLPIISTKTIRTF